MTKIAFDRNSTSAHFGGLLQRLREECFTFYARKGQNIVVDISDFNDSTGMTIYKPGFKINYGNYTDDDKYSYGWGDSRIPLNTYSGETITPSPEKQESLVQKYVGRLSQTGTYLIVVGLSGADASRWGGTVSIK